MTAQRPPRVVLYHAGTGADHFRAAGASLAARGALVEENPLRYLAPKLWRAGDPPDVLAADDAVGPHAREALRAARRDGVRTALLMDGVAERRNTFTNPRTGPAFLRPAPADVVLCAGALDAAVLRALGNTTVATGLPRLAGAATAPPRDPAGPVLVATARTPCFTPEERPRVLDALARVRDAARRQGAPILWRLTGELDRELDVASDDRPLSECLAEAGAVLTTPSTLLLEAMLADRPAAILNPYGGPCWAAARWLIECDTTPGDDPNARAADDAARRDVPTEPVRRFGLGEIDDALAALRAATPEDLDAQRRLRDAMCAPPADASDRIAGALLELARREPTPSAAPIPETSRTPPRRNRTARRRVVVVLSALEDGDDLGALDRIDAPGAEILPLLITDQPWRLPPRARAMADEGRAEHAAIDRSLPHWDVIERASAAIAALEPDEVVCAPLDAALAACARLASEGTPWRPLPGTGESGADLYSVYKIQSGAFTLTDDRRWTRSWTDDPDRADAACRRALQRAGYTRIAQDRPAPGCDAALIGARSTLPDPRTLTAWRAQGLAVVTSPDLVPDSAAYRLRRTVQELKGAGCERIALYPFFAGQLRRAVAAVADDPRVVGFIDDDPGRCDRALGRPLVPLDRAAALAPDAVVLSPGPGARALAERCGALARRGMRVVVAGRPLAGAPVGAASA